jgi:hypothetical protein
VTRLLPAAALVLVACSGKLNPTQRGVDTGVPRADGEGGAVGPGWLEVEGETRCTVDDRELVGFCGESPTTFWADGSTDLAEADCARSLGATVWMSAQTWADSVDHRLVPETNELEANQATVWFDLDDETWVSDGGRATATEVGVDTVRVDFETEATVDFLTRETPGPVVRGQVWCTRAGD